MEFSFADIALSLALVALAIALTLYWKIPVQKDMAFGSVRAFIQLIAVGYALKYIFQIESGWLIHLALLIMTVVGARAAGSRVKKLKGASVIAFIAMTLGSVVTIGLLLALRIVPFEARYVIPLAGMIIGNSMNAAALTANRLVSDLRQNRAAIETALALGKTWREASRPFQKEAAVAGMISILNFMKTVGIVALPGAMTGMILAGAEPLEAIMLQLIVAYMLLAAVTVTSVVALELTVRRFFTAQHQLAIERACPDSGKPA